MASLCQNVCHSGAEVLFSLRDGNGRGQISPGFGGSFFFYVLVNYIFDGLV